MDALREATAALRLAEQQLRSIIVKAAESGDYDHLSLIAGWAKMLGATMSGRLGTGAERIQPEAIPASTAGNGVSLPRPAPVSDRAPSTVTRKAKGGRRKKVRRSKAAKSEYPKFVREGDLLVKIGWSKSESKTYEHKAPRGVLQALVQALIHVGSGGERFTVDGMLPLKDTTSGSEIPDYQAYLTLAWLRNVDLVTQHGRQGYSLPQGKYLERECERLWDQLITR
jgi:hypothetical protein